MILQCFKFKILQIGYDFLSQNFCEKPKLIRGLSGCRVDVSCRMLINRYRMMANSVYMGHWNLRQLIVFILMSLLKQKVTTDSKSQRKPSTARSGAPELNGLSDKKNQPHKMGETPKKESSNSKGNYAAWSGKKRLAVVRDEQNITTDKSTNQEPAQNTDSNEDNRSDNDHVKEYGFSDLISRHKSTHAEIYARGNPEYYFKRNDKDHQGNRLVSPQMYTTRQRRSAYEPNQHVIRRISVEQAAKENSVNKNNVQLKPNLQELANIRSVSTINKKIESMSTIQPSSNDNSETKLGATIKFIGASSNQLTVNGKPIAFDIRSSTTITRESSNVLDHISDKDRMNAQSREPKRSTSNHCFNISQNPQFSEITEAKSICTKAEHSTIGQLETDHSELKVKFSRYERILSEKQKDISKLELENHNLKIEIKNVQSRLSTVQGEKSKIIQLHTISQSCIESLRKEIQDLRMEAANIKSKGAQDLMKSEKDARQQYGQLIHQKNNQISKLNLALQNKQTDINNIKQELTRQMNEVEKIATKHADLEKLTDYYKKQNKMIGIELFNAKKKLQGEVKEKIDLQAKFIELNHKAEYFGNKIHDLERIIQVKDNELAQKLRQSQHEKNLLYDSMSNNTKLKDSEIASLRKELTLSKHDMQKSSVLASSQEGNIVLIDSLKRELQQTCNDLKASKLSLSKQISQKQKILVQKRQLGAALHQRQKRQDQQRIKLHQSQSLKSFDLAPKPPQTKNSEVDKLIQQLNVKSIEITNLGKTLKNMQQRYSAQQSLLSSTNEELFVLRLQSLTKKLQPY